jgi:hypothetical protein
MPSVGLENTSKFPGANVGCLQEEIKRLTVGPENSVCALTLRRADRQLTVHLGNPPPPPSAWALALLSRALDSKLPPSFNPSGPLRCALPVVKIK